MHLVRPPAREFRWEALHATLVLALLLHLVGLLACLWSGGKGEDPELRVIAQVELVDRLPEPTRPEPLRLPPPPLPPVLSAPARPQPDRAAPAEPPPAPSAPSAPSSPPAPSAPSAPSAASAPPAPSAPSALPALPGAGVPRAGRPSARPPRPPASSSGPAAPTPAPAPVPSPSATAVRAAPPSATAVRSAPPPAAAPPGPAPGAPKWAWFPGPDQPRPVSSGRVDPAKLAGLGPARVWVEMRIPANGGRNTAPTDIAVHEIEGGDKARLAAVATEMARTSLWSPGSRDGAPADHTVRLYLEITR